MNDRLVIIPTYNEKENIENIIRCVFSLKPAFDILIIEDNSPDGTAGIVKTLQKEFTNLHIIERKGKLGLGTAYICGFKWAIEHKYDFIFEGILFLFKANKEKSFLKKANKQTSNPIESKD